jgi:virulence-associated protein VapD
LTQLLFVVVVVDNFPLTNWVEVICLFSLLPKERTCSSGWERHLPISQMNEYLNSWLKLTFSSSKQKLILLNLDHFGGVLFWTCETKLIVRCSTFTLKQIYFLSIHKGYPPNWRVTQVMTLLIWFDPSVRKIKFPWRELWTLNFSDIISILFYLITRSQVSSTITELTILGHLQSFSASVANLRAYFTLL